MKLAIAITTATTLFSNSALAQNANVSFDTGADEECCIDTVRAATEAAGYSLSTWFGDDEAAQSQAIEALCDSARSKNSNPNRGAYNFKRITGQGWQFDNNYFDGGTFLNEEYEPVEVDFDDVFEEVAQDSLITYPDDSVAKNFADCEAQSVMCCWVQDRYDDGNGNGNCDQDDCKDADPADNTNVCYVDMEAGSASSHVGGGGAVFSRVDDEGATHCHGFAWEDDEVAKDYRYRGNLLFYVSMYDHLSERGYVREVPGAPMCACVERMPVVEESDCTEADITETYTFRFRNNGNHRADITNVDIEYNACTNNELADRFDELENVSDEAADIFEQYIVGQGNCDAVFDEWFEEKYGYVQA